MQINSISEDIAYWLAAVRMPNIGPAKFRRWLNSFADIKALFSASEMELRFAGIKPKEIHALKNPDWKKVEKDLTWSEKNTCQIISLHAAHYPRLLLEIHGAPLVLFVRGDVKLLSQPQLSMVGSRNPTAVGSELAEQFAECLTKSGLIINSGLALGIDAASHRGALKAQGKTIAVLGTGLNHVYPASNRKLAEEIIAQGTLISEFTPDTPPIATNFPQRNRIISGLSLGVLVIEAALQSGSLITARYAIEQGRDVFAIPGSIHNPLARGCHQLIRQGAKLVETAEDILEELDALRAVLTQKNESVSSALEVGGLEIKQQQLLQQVGYEATALDTIIVRSGLTSSEVSSMLLLLELQGYVQAVPGGYVRVTVKLM